VFVVVIEKRAADPPVTVLQITSKAERFESEQDV
jgi:hypothetical protein